MALQLWWFLKAFRYSLDLSQVLGQDPGEADEPRIKLPGAQRSSRAVTAPCGRVGDVVPSTCFLQRSVLSGRTVCAGNLCSVLLFKLPARRLI